MIDHNQMSERELLAWAKRQESPDESHGRVGAAVLALLARAEAAEAKLDTFLGAMPYGELEAKLAAAESREKALREKLAEVEQRKENERRDIVRGYVSLRNDLERSMERMDAAEAGEKTMREALFDVCGLKETICDEPSGFAIGRHPETREWRVWHVDYPDEGSILLRAALAAGEETDPK